MDIVPALSELRKLWDRGVRTQPIECSWKEYRGVHRMEQIRRSSGRAYGR